MPELYKRFVRNGQVVLRFALHEGQMAARHSIARIVAIIAGFQSGKTCFEPIWLHQEIVNRGPGEYLASSSTYPLFDLKFLPEMVRYFCHWIRWGTYHAGKQVIMGHAGACEADKSKIFLRSASNPESLMSGTFNAAVCDEWGQKSVGVESYEAVQRGLAVKQGRLLIGTTPYTLGWLKQQVYDRWVGGDPDYEVINFESRMNPNFKPEEWERLKGILPPWKFDMFYRGLFVRPAGLIYGDYIDSYAQFTESGAWIGGGHLVRNFTIPATWLRDVCIDFGGAEHCARLWIAEDPVTHYYYVYREKLGGSASGSEYAKEVLEYGEILRYCVGGAKSEEQSRQEWRIAGLPVIEPAITDVEPGIDHVISLFRQNRLFVLDSLNGLRSELGTYSRELDDAGEPLIKIEDKERFHRLDALRAGCSYYALTPPKPKVEEVIDPTSRKPADIRKLHALGHPQKKEEGYY